MSASIAGIKKGETLELPWSLPLDFASLVSSIESQVRTSGGGLIQQLTVVRLADDSVNANWQISATDEQTLSWPARILVSDIKHNFTDGKVVYSDTYMIPVEKAETHD